MPLQTRALTALAFAASLTGAANAECAIDQREIKTKLAALGFAENTGEPISKATREPEFSDVALGTGTDGEVGVLLIIAPDGKVADRVVLCAQPFGYFQPAVLDWTKGFAFAPLPAGAAPQWRSYTVFARFRFDYSGNGSRIRP